MFTGQIAYQLTVQHLPEIDSPIITFYFGRMESLLKGDMMPCSLHVLS